MRWLSVECGEHLLLALPGLDIESGPERHEDGEVRDGGGVRVIGRGGGPHPAEEADDGSGHEPGRVVAQPHEVEPDLLAEVSLRECVTRTRRDKNESKREYLRGMHQREGEC